MKNQAVALRVIAKPPSLTAPLASLTSDSHRPRVVVGFIANGWTPPAMINPDVAKTIPAQIVEHEIALTPADPRAVRVHLTRLAMNCRMEDMPAKAWEMHLADFIADLSDVPEDIVMECCTVWRRTQKFWPTISEFLEMTVWRLRKRRADLERLRVLERVAENPAPNGMVTMDWLRVVTR